MALHRTPVKLKKSAGGRPTLEQTEQISDRILDAAAHFFFTIGLDATTIDQIVVKAGMSKRTLYVRFSSKEDIFEAVVQKRIDACLAPIAAIRAAQSSLEESLIRIGIEMNRAVVSPDVTALERVIITEARKFPALARSIHNYGSIKARNMVADFLANASDSEQLADCDVQFLADEFIHTIVSGPSRNALLGIEGPSSDQALRKLVKRRVSLFLRGCLAREPKKTTLKKTAQIGNPNKNGLI